MEKMRFETKNITDENIQKILELFPNVATEAIGDNGELKTAIDFEKLKQELSEVVIDGEESYDFTWVGKKEAMVEANRPIRKTLRPDRESSVDWENTQNIYIEGDNLEALKLLQESYLGKVKMIYIDPPYNTGNDFIYNDTFSMDKDDYEEEIEYKDEDGNINFKKNDTSNPRYHSDWCSMIYSRLKLARNLLTYDGIIFISIDDNEVKNLEAICNEIFGETNKIACCPRIAKRTSNKGTFFKPTKDYILVYASSINNINEKFGVKSIINLKDYKYEDKKGKYKKNGASLYQPSLDSRPNQRYWVECPDGTFIIPPGTVFPDKLEDGAHVKPLSNSDKCWRWSYETYLNKKDLLIFTPASNNCPLIDSNGQPSKWNIYDKVYLDDKQDEMLLPEDVIYDYVNSQGTKELIDLNIPFTFAKPKGLIQFLMSISNVKNEDIILDFFSGSATTAHAVMQLNAEDDGNRKFIMVQLPEKTDEKSDAYMAGYPNICEIGKERIRRAGKKIQEENPDKKIDVGFRVFKVDDTNMNDVYYTPNELHQTQLGLLESNIKSDRTDEDLLYGCLLDWGVELSLPHRVEIIDGKRVHIVDEDALIACFEDQVSESVMRKIAEMKPTRVVFKDGSFVGDANKINVEEIFKLISPETTVKVI